MRNFLYIALGALLAGPGLAPAAQPAAEPKAAGQAATSPLYTLLRLGRSGQGEGGTGDVEHGFGEFRVIVTDD